MSTNEIYIGYGITGAFCFFIAVLLWKLKPKNVLAKSIMYICSFVALYVIVISVLLGGAALLDKIGLGGSSSYYSVDDRCDRDPLFGGC